jgi:hypothetical protein
MDGTLIEPATNHFVVRSLIALILYALVLVPRRLARVAAGLLAAPRVLYRRQSWPGLTTSQW